MTNSHHSPIWSQAPIRVRQASTTAAHTIFGNAASVFSAYVPDDTADDVPHQVVVSRDEWTRIGAKIARIFDLTKISGRPRFRHILDVSQLMNALDYLDVVIDIVRELDKAIETAETLTRTNAELTKKLALIQSRDSGEATRDKWLNKVDPSWVKGRTFIPGANKYIPPTRRDTQRKP